MIQPLTKEAFAAALRTGRGRAYLHVLQFGLSGVGDVVLAACLQDQAYDPQCEPSRAGWLLSMFEGTEEYQPFSTAIVDALERETDTWDSQQLCELAALMGKRGDKKAHEALRRRVLRRAETAGGDDWVGVEELLSLDGLAAVVDLAQRYGRILIENPEESPPLLDDLTEELDFLAQSETTLQALAGSDAEIRAYLTYWRKRKAARARRATHKSKMTREELREVPRERFRRMFPLEKMLEDAAAEKGSFPGRYTRFGMNATQEELGAVFHRLEQETTEGVCQRLLWVFRRAELPQISPKIWQLTASNNKDVQSAAIEALAQLRDRRVGELGRSRLRSHDFTEGDSELLDLFIRNYVPGDEELVMAVLQGLVPISDNAHYLCLSLLDIAEENHSPLLLPLLTWAYEMTPCTDCRFRALKLLRDLGAISQEIIRECLFDANEDIQQIAKSVQGCNEV